MTMTWRLGRLMVVACLAAVAASAAAAAQWGREPDPAAVSRFTRASLVFATHDLSSPVSLFGHTFLVLHDQPEPEPDALVVEFGGVVRRPADHVAALLSHIPGRFALSHFSTKEREYAADGRSLWVYPLRLEPEAQQALARQAQAVIGQERPYTFLRSNCSHHILALVARAAGLDAEEPDWPFVVPVDTLRALAGRGLLAPPQHRPAASARALAAHARLDAAGRARFESYRLDPDQPGPEAEDSPVALALSAAAEHWALVELQTARRDAWYRLKRRFPRSADLEPPRQDPLDTGAHASWSWVQGLDGTASTLGWSYGFLSFRNEDLSALRHAELQLLDLVVSRRDGRLRLDRLGLLAMEANQPASPVAGGFTQRLDLAYVNDTAQAGRRAERLLLRFGRGVTWPLGGVDVSALPFIALGGIDGGAGWAPAAAVGLRGSAHASLPSGWRARAQLEWYGRELAGLRALHRFELAAPTLDGRHGFGLQAEVRNGQLRDAMLGLRWTFRPRPP